MDQRKKMDAATKNIDTEAPKVSRLYIKQSEQNSEPIVLQYVTIHTTLQGCMSGVTLVTFSASVQPIL